MPDTDSENLRLNELIDLKIPISNFNLEMMKLRTAATYVKTCFAYRLFLLSR